MLKTYALCTLAHRRIGRLHDQYAWRVRLARPFARILARPSPRALARILARPLAFTLPRPLARPLARCSLSFRTKFTCERGWYLFLFLTLRCFLLHEVHVRTGLILSLLHVSVFPPSRSKFTRERGCFLFHFSIGTILLLARGTCWDLYRFTFLHSCHVSGSIPFHVLHRCHVSSAFYHVHAMLCFGLLY